MMVIMPPSNGCISDYQAARRIIDWMIIEPEESDGDAEANDSPEADSGREGDYDHYHWMIIDPGEVEARRKSFRRVGADHSPGFFMS